MKKLENYLKGILIGAGLTFLTSCATYHSVDNSRYRYPYLLTNMESEPREEKKDGSGWKFVPLLPINIGAKIIRGERISALDFIHDLVIVGGGYSIIKNNKDKDKKQSGSSSDPYSPDSGPGDDGDKDGGGW